MRSAVDVRERRANAATRSEETGGIRELRRREKEPKKDGLPRILEGWNYGSKNRNQSHWLKAAWPREEYLARWRAELPGSPLSTCLPLPPIPASLFLSFPGLSLLSVPSPPRLSSSARFFVFFFLLLLHLAGLPTSRGGPPRRSRYHLYPWSVYHTDTRGESFHANSPRTPSSWSVGRRARCRTRSPVKTVTRRPADRSKATSFAGIVFFDPSRTRRKDGPGRETRSILSA